MAPLFLSFRREVSATISLLHCSYEDIRVEKRTTLDRVAESIVEDRNLATATETVLDQEFVEKYKDDWCWVGNGNTPLEPRWYKIDRANQKLTKIRADQASRLAWHERLFIYQSALTATKEGSNLALYIGGEYDDGRLTALYLCGPDYLAWVATK